MKKKMLPVILLLLVTILLEMLPYGAVCNFANPEGAPFRETYSYFDLVPFGYANFGPLLTAVMSCVLLLLTVVWCFSGHKKLLYAIKLLFAVCSVISLTPLLYGIRFFSIVGALISALLIMGTVLLFFITK